jgi:hypothetical protein
MTTARRPSASASRPSSPTSSRTPRCYANPLQAAEEAGRSRIFQGIHFQFSKRTGVAPAGGIGAEIVTTRLRRVDS